MAAPVTAEIPLRRPVVLTGAVLEEGAGHVGPRYLLHEDGIATAYAVIGENTDRTQAKRKKKRYEGAGTGADEGINQWFAHPTFSFHDRKGLRRSAQDHL